MLFNNFYDQLSPNGKLLVDEGYFITNIEKIKTIDYFKNLFIRYLVDNYGLVNPNISELHDFISYETVNKLRYGFFQYINNPDYKIILNYLELAKDAMYDVVGSELSANRTLNCSIQLPNDKSSLLPVHSDVFSGESEFQINLWVPLVSVSGTNSMFIFKPEISKYILKNIKKYENTGIECILNEYPNDYQFIKLNYGQALIFTPTCLHGNVVNKTNITRVSFNCRYKNLFSPYNQYEENEKKLGSFYEPLIIKAASLIGFEHRFE